jgi:uncharacterized sulfatase
LACAKRPAEELYDIEKDWGQIRNCVADPAYAGAKAEMRAGLEAYLKETGDPRMTGGEVIWDSVEFYGKGRL